MSQNPFRSRRIVSLFGSVLFCGSAQCRVGDWWIIECSQKAVAITVRDGEVIMFLNDVLRTLARGGNNKRCQVAVTGQMVSTRKQGLGFRIDAQINTLGTCLTGGGFAAGLWALVGIRVRISHEWIYQYIYTDKRSGGDLYRYLRCQKMRRKRYGTYDRRGIIPNQVSIDKRPAIVDASGASETGRVIP